MDFLWISYGFPMDFPIDFPMDVPMDFPMDFLLDFLWISYEFPMDFSWISLRISYGFPYGFPMDFPMGFLRISLWIFFFCTSDFQSSRLNIQRPSCQIAFVHGESDDFKQECRRTSAKEPKKNQQSQPTKTSTRTNRQPRLKRPA